METLARLEETAISILFRESGVAFFGSLVVHSLALALVVGVNIAVCLTLLGYRLPSASVMLAKSFNAADANLHGSPLPLSKYFSRFFRLHWCGVLLVFLSGALLLLAYPAKALTNPVFYLKLACLSSALIGFRRLQLHATVGEPNSLNERRQRFWAIAIIVLWVITLAAGRFLAYTNSVLLASRFF